MLAPIGSFNFWKFSILNRTVNNTVHVCSPALLWQTEIIRLDNIKLHQDSTRTGSVGRHCSNNNCCYYNWSFLPEQNKTTTATNQCTWGNDSQNTWKTLIGFWNPNINTWKVCHRWNSIISLAKNKYLLVFLT